MPSRQHTRRHALRSCCILGAIDGLVCRMARCEVDIVPFELIGIRLRLREEGTERIHRNLLGQGAIVVELGYLEKELLVRRVRLETELVRRSVQVANDVGFPEQHEVRDTAERADQLELEAILREIYPGLIGHGFRLEDSCRTKELTPSFSE